MNDAQFLVNQVTQKSELAAQLQPELLLKLQGRIRHREKQFGFDYENMLIFYSWMILPSLYKSVGRGLTDKELGFITSIPEKQINEIKKRESFQLAFKIKPDTEHSIPIIRNGLKDHVSKDEYRKQIRKKDVETPFGDHAIPYYIVRKDRQELIQQYHHNPIFQESVNPIIGEKEKKIIDIVHDPGAVDIEKAMNDPDLKGLMTKNQIFSMITKPNQTRDFFLRLLDKVIIEINKVKNNTSSFYNGRAWLYDREDEFKQNRDYILTSLDSLAKRYSNVQDSLVYGPEDMVKLVSNEKSKRILIENYSLFLFTLVLLSQKTFKDYLFTVQ